MSSDKAIGGRLMRLVGGGIRSIEEGTFVKVVAGVDDIMALKDVSRHRSRMELGDSIGSERGFAHPLGNLKDR